MRILLVLPGTLPQVIDISGTLESMQSLVGGLIQAVYPFGEPVAVICNDEGKLLNLQPNRFLRTHDTGEIYDYISGPFFLCAAPPNSSNFDNLSDEQITRYTNYYSQPFTMIGGEIYG